MTFACRNQYRPYYKITTVCTPNGLPASSPSGTRHTPRKVSSGSYPAYPSSTSPSALATPRAFKTAPYRSHILPPSWRIPRTKNSASDSTPRQTIPVATPGTSAQAWRVRDDRREGHLRLDGRGGLSPMQAFHQPLEPRELLRHQIFQPGKIEFGIFFFPFFLLFL